MNRRLMERQLIKCGLTLDDLPKDLASWKMFLERIVATYEQHDKDRYLLERSLEISSKEMEENIEVNKQMSLKLAQANKLASIGTLASGVAHELNNPLAGIRGYAEALQLDANLTSEETSSLNRILHLSDRMAKTIQQLLKISRQTNEIENESCNLKVCIDEALELMQKQLDSNHIKLNIMFKTSKVSIRGSSHRIASVLQNLFSNSRDAFMSKSDIKNPCIEISVSDSVALPGGICIEFKDNAGGIDEKIVNHVFDPFFTTKDVGMGTGLGLAILSRRFFSEGYDVDLAANGKHAIQKLQSGKKYDLIICDLKMPIINGSSLIIELRRARFTAPIVVLTGFPDRSWLTAAAPWGIDAIFLKPFKASELLSKIKDLFAKSNVVEISQIGS